MKVFAILPAAGLGTRMATAGGAAPNAPKQFLTIAGAPILVHSLKAFSAVPRIAQIVVAVRKNEIARTEEQVRPSTSSPRSASSKAATTASTP